MPLRTAGALCPHAVFLPVDGRKYGRVSREVMAILRRYTPLVEPISIDEGVPRTSPARAAVRGWRDDRSSDQGDDPEELGPDRVGRGRTTKLVAKIGSDLAKPDGWSSCRRARRQRSSRRSDHAPVGRRARGPPTHWRASACARSVTWRRCRATPSNGATGRSASRSASGRWASIPDVVDGGDPAKSVSHEHTFDVDTSGARGHRTVAAGHGRRRSRAVCAGSGIKASTIALKLRDSNFRTITRQTTLPEPTDLTEPIYRAATQLLRKELKGQRIRLVGVAASNFREKEQLGLFTAPDEPRRHQVAEAADTIRKRFGERAVTPGRAS
jgi:DNA polymerase-4